MLRRIARCSLACIAFFAVAGSAPAQTWTPEQQEIWQLEAQQWQMSKDEDLSWIEKLAHPALSYWETGQEMPQNRASLSRWNRYAAASNTVLEQEIFPISLTITGNVAVAHYHYQIVREGYDKKRETVQGRYTDVLIKEGGRWQFIAWTGGDDPKKQ